MSVFDIVTLAIAGVFVIIGFLKGFLKLVLKFGVAVLAVVTARLFGSGLGRMLFPNLIKSSSSIGARFSTSSLENINASIATVLGTLIVFAVVFIVFKLIAGIVSKAVSNGFKSKLTDKILGMVLGLALAAGIVYAFAFAVDIVAIVISFIHPSTDIYELINDTVIFKYFF